MSCIDTQTVELVLKTLDEKYSKTAKDVLSPYETQVREIFTAELLKDLGNDIISGLNNEETAIDFFDYNSFIKTVCILLPNPPTGGDDPDTNLVTYESAVYFSFSNKDLRSDIYAIGYFLIALSLIYLGVTRIDKFNEQIMGNEFNLQISYTDMVSFKAIWDKIRGHNFCETIASNIINKAVTIGIKTSEQALQNCWTFNPASSQIALALSTIETWAAPEATMTCIKDYANLEFAKMKIDLKHKANSLPLGFFFLWVGITASGSCIGYLSYRLGFNKIASNAIDNISENIEELGPSRIAGNTKKSKKSKKNRKNKKKTKKNRKRSRKSRNKK